MQNVTPLNFKLRIILSIIIAVVAVAAAAVLLLTAPKPEEEVIIKPEEITGDGTLIAPTGVIPDNTDNGTVGENGVYIPQNLIAVAGDESVVLSWDKLDGVTGYRVFYYQNKSAVYKAFDYCETNQITVTSLTNGYEYFFKVCAYTYTDNTVLFSDLSLGVAAVPINTEVKLDSSALILESGDLHQLNCLLNNSNISAEWKSSNTTTATVSSDGVVKARAKGKTVITATTSSGSSDCTVYVGRDAYAPLDEIEPSRLKSSSDGWYKGSVDGTFGEATLLFTGDLSATSKQQNAAIFSTSYDFNGSFKLVKAALSDSDLVVGSLDTMLSESNPYMNEQAYRYGSTNANAQQTYLDALRYAGFDFLVAANDRNADTGPVGLRETLAHLTEYNLPTTGIFAEKESPRFLGVEINGVKIALLSYTQKSFNGKTALFTEDEQSYMLNVYSAEKLKTDLAAAREAGAEYIVVYMHWGTHNASFHNQGQYDRAHELAEAGVDLIVGSSPGVLQRVSLITTSDNRVVPVAYSLGNFCSSVSDLSANTATVILRAEIKRVNGVITTECSYLPCGIVGSYDGDNYVTVPLTYDYGNLITTDYIKSTRNIVLSHMGNSIKPYEAYYNVELNAYDDDIALLRSNYDIEEYLGLLSDDRYSLLVGVKGDGSSGLDEELASAFSVLGLRESLYDKGGHAYIAVTNKGNLVYEKLEKAPLTYTGVFYNHSISLESAGYDDGDSISMSIDSVENSLGRQGINIIVYDTMLKCFVDNVTFNPESRTMSRNWNE